MAINKVQIYDLMGRLILEHNVDSHKIQLDLNEQRSSIYMLKMTYDDASTEIKRLIKK